MACVEEAVQELGGRQACRKIQNESLQFEGEGLRGEGDWIQQPVVVRATELEDFTSATARESARFHRLRQQSEHKPT